MKLLYITEANLRDRLFIRDLVFSYKLKDKAILIHDTFGGTVRDTRFVTKRISAMLSETMVYNNAFSADQRNLFSLKESGNMEIDAEKIHKLLETVQLLIIGPVIKKGDSTELADPLQMVEVTRTYLDISDMIVFTSNPLSPLGAKNIRIETDADLEKMITVYEEESAALRLAHRLRPARITSPANYSQ
ncbi:MAG: hypothetical protein SF052_18380 [Bacteroidia bacterium]|nr:hypothetical protein [Bacteroidia bacterium]